MAHTTRTREDVEILIHTSAPSRGQDDTRYRAFARAYLNFEPATNVQLEDDPESNVANDEGFEVETQEELLHSMQEEYDENASYCPPTQDPETNPGAYKNEITEEELSDLMYSPQLSFRSVLDNRNSPIFRTRSRKAVDLGSQSAEEMPRQRQSINSLPAQRQPSSVIEDSMPENSRMLPEYSSPTRILELHLQQGESTQDSPDVSRVSQFTDESSLNLEVPQAIPFSSSQSHEARTNSDVAPSLPPRRYKSISPPRRPHTIRYRHISPFPDSTTDTDAPNAISSDSFNNVPTSGQAASTLKRRTSQTMETEDKAEFKNGDKDAGGISKSIPISSTPEIPATSSSLPQYATSKRRRVDFPISIDNSPKGVKLVISDTTADTSSASLPALQIPPTSKAPEAPIVRSSLPPMSSLPSPESLATCTIPSIIPVTSSGDLTPASLITPSLALINTHKKAEVLGERFNPTLQTRPCLPFERGYWLINTQAFSEELKQRFWAFLFRCIPKGGAGWGVSAERTEDWKSFRVNCWGGVAREIYLMLFLASDGKMKGGDACWKDGGGETVISWT
ncbi:hypothetical protein NHQ30_000936 [Ciborinia camelliae]|nr:hypothetical protein NHQ30_000936 [Ciborinia camelliae]